jgi:hypothetical protein
MNDFETRHRTRADLDRVRDQLVAEFGFELPPGTVLRHVASAREELLRAGVRVGLAHAVEAMARRRLTELLPAHAGAAY